MTRNRLRKWKRKRTYAFPRNRKMVVLQYIGERLERKMPINLSDQSIIDLIEEVEPVFFNEQRVDPKRIFNNFYRRFIKWTHKEEVLAGKDDYVYVVGNLSQNLCKIGYSKTPWKRIPYIQTGCPFPLYVLAIYKGKGKSYEGALHEVMHPHWVRGEWFKIAGEIKTVVENNVPIPVALYAQHRIEPRRKGGFKTRTRKVT